MTIRAPGQIYIAEFSNGLIKVGFSGYARGRLAQHAAGAAKGGLVVSRQWHSTMHANAGANETALIEYCSSVGSRARPRGEYFSQIRFQDVLAYAQTLHLEVLNDTSVSVEEARAKLGPLVNDAAVDGTITYLTLHGRRYAALVPLDRIKDIEHADQNGDSE